MKNTIPFLILLIFLAACSPALPQINTPPSATPHLQTPTEQIAASLTPFPSTATPSPQPTATFTPSPTPEPTARRGTFINIFCLSVTQNIEGSDFTPNEPITDTLGRVLAGSGLVFVPNATTCDAVLQLDFTFIPQSYQYKSEGSDELATCFTGASLRGTADLNFQGASLFHRDLQGEYVPAGGTSSCPQAHLAPFVNVWPQAGMQALTEIWGKNVLVPALLDPFPSVREAAAQSLYLLSEAELLSFLPFLTTTLQDNSDVVRLRVLEALQRILRVDSESVAALTPQIIKQLGRELNPEAAQKEMALLVSFAVNNGRQTEVAAGLRQVLENSQPYPQGMIPNSMILDGIAALGPLALDTAPALINMLAEAENQSYAGQIQAALKAISGEDYGTDTQQWQAWWEKQ